MLSQELHLLRNPLKSPYQSTIRSNRTLRLNAIEAFCRLKECERQEHFRKKTLLQQEAPREELLPSVSSFLLL